MRVILAQFISIFVFFSLSILSFAFDIDRGLVNSVGVENLSDIKCDKAYVKSHISLKPGMPLDRAVISQDIKNLMKTARFSDVKVFTKFNGNKIDVIYGVSPRPVLQDPVIINGCDEFTESKIRDMVDLSVGDYVDEWLLGNIKQKILKSYKDDLFYNAKVSFEIKPNTNHHDRVDVVINIEEGKKSKVSDVSFSGNTVFSDSKLKNIFKRSVWYNPLSWFRAKKYDAEIFEKARNKIYKMYADKGYLDAKISKPKVFKNPDNTLTVVLNIEEGKQFRFGKIRIVGAEDISLLMLSRLIPAREGDIANAKTLEKSIKAINDYYGSKGYIDTTVRPLLDSNPDKQIMNVTFKIHEGSLTYVNNIYIKGNTRTKDKVILREIMVDPGDIYNLVKINVSEKRLRNLGFFSVVRTYPADTLYKDKKDLIIEVKEKPTGNLMLGFGFSSIDKLMGFFEISQGNFDLFNWPHFTGGGQKLKFNMQYGSTRQEYGISFIEPWFMDRKLLLGFDIYSKDIANDDYSDQKRGVSLSLAKSIFDNNRAHIRYSLEETKIHNVSDTNEYFYANGDSYYFDSEEDATLSSLRLTLSRDLRDNTFVSTKGYSVRAYFDLKGGILGFDRDLYEIGLSGIKYFPLWSDHVLSIQGRYQVVEPYGKTDEVPIYDRLFIGGGRTIRGFKYRDVGPKVTRTVNEGEDNEYVEHRPIGGQSLALMKVEYVIPVASKVRFAVFYDIGNVWEDPYVLHTEGLASSYGIGLRLDMPGFPIRIDYAKIINKDDDLTSSEPWVVWMGREF